MTLLDGHVSKSSFIERLVDPLMSSRRLLASALVAFSACVVTAPIVMYVAFSHFNDREAPWWFDPMMMTWSLVFTLSCFAMVLLVLAKPIESRRD